MPTKRSLSHFNCARRLSVLADANRLAVLEKLMEGSKYVWQLNDDLELEQSLLSHHLKVLRQAGLVESSRDGKSVLYRLAPRVKPDASRAIDLGCCILLFDKGDRFESNPSSLPNLPKC